MEKNKHPSGFTLVELLVVIAVVGILVSLLLPAIQSARESARMMSCKNNLKQIGIGLHLHHDTLNVLPSGWIASVSEPHGDPGWGWGTMLLPYMEETSVLAGNFNPKLPIGDPQYEALRESTIPVFLCPSEPYEGRFWLPKDDGHDHHGHDDDDDDHDDHDDDDDHDEEGHDPAHEGHYDEGEPLLMVARANYVGMFGTEEVDENPSRGDGVFYHNSRLALKNVVDGLSKTIFVGERSSRLGGSTWVGNVHEAKQSMARIVGSADHLPNSRGAHFEDFSSRHPQGAHFLFGDGGVRLIGNLIEKRVYRAMATRAGSEVFSMED